MLACADTARTLWELDAPWRCGEACGVVEELARKHGGSTVARERAAILKRSQEGVGAMLVALKLQPKNFERRFAWEPCYQ